MPVVTSNSFHSIDPSRHNIPEGSPTSSRNFREVIRPQNESSINDLKNRRIKRSNTEITSSERPKLSNSKLKVSKVFHQKLSSSLSTHPCYIENLTREKAEEELKPLAIGTWLIRYSANQNNYVVSQKTSIYKVTHYNIQQCSFEYLEERFGQFSQIHLFKTIRSHHNTTLLVLVEHKKEQTPISKYDYQLQLNLGRGVTASMLETKAHRHQLEVETIHLNPHAEELTSSTEKISKLTHHSRLYLIGHAHAGTSKVTSEEKTDLTYDYTLTVSHFVNLLKNKAPHLQKQEDGKRLTISLVACYAGIEGLSGEKSFALQLSQALDQAGIPAEILARTATVQGEPSLLQKQVAQRHHSTGDKISVVTINGQSTIRIVQYEDMIELKTKKLKLVS